MNKWKLTAIILTTVIGTFLFLAIWGSTMDDEYTEAPVGDVQVRTDFVEPEQDISFTEFRQTYVDGCTEQGAPTEYCQCTFMYINDEIGLDAFKQMAMDYLDNPEPTQLMYDAVNFCVE